MRRLSYTIPPEWGGRPLQDYLRQVQGYSRRMRVRLKHRPGSICRNGEPVRMVDLLRPGDLIEIRLEDDRQTAGPGRPGLDAPILYEDEDLVLYHKPPFMAVHPSRDHQEDTLANVFCRHLQELGQDRAVFRPVYRLDRDTEGLCLIAKNALAAAKLAGRVEKEYVAILCGEDLPDEGRIDAPIAQLEPHRMQRGVRPDGQLAVTHYRIVQRGGGYAKAVIRLETGRTHQIRVHFSYLGYPLAGDSMYGGDCSHLNQQALCCRWIRFLHPTQEIYMEFCINMQNKLDNLLHIE